MNASPAQDRAPTPQGRVAEWNDVDAATFWGDIASRYEPAVLRGFVADWPAVKASLQSPESGRDYLARFDRGAAVRAFVAPSEIEGRFFYRPQMDGFNFGMAESRVTDLVTKILEADQDQKLSIYMGSTSVPRVLPGFERENDMPLLRSKRAEPRIWIGTQSRIAPHFDESDNIACVVRGRRRFTLFPTEEVANLYVGPLDQTVAGQPTSMVDLKNPDYGKFPRFREALSASLVAELEPGDAIYIPPLWWHHVEGLDSFNILVNYWWSDAPPDAGSPLHALAHGLLTISHLRKEQREAWRSLFDHYVFKRNGEPAEHIPEQARGILAESTPELRQRMKQFLLRTLGHR